MQQARRDRLAAAKTGFDMGIPFNQLNRVLDLGFQPLLWGNIGYLPNNIAPVSGTAASAGLSPTGPAPGGATSQYH